MAEGMQKGEGEGDRAATAGPAPAGPPLPAIRPPIIEMATEKQALFMELLSNFLSGGNAWQATRRDAIAALQLCKAAKFGTHIQLRCWAFKTLMHHENAARRWAVERANAAQEDLRRIVRLVRSNTDDGPRGDAVERVTDLIGKYNVDHATVNRLLYERPDLAETIERVRRQANFWQGTVASDVDTSDDDDEDQDVEGDEP